MSYIKINLLKLNEKVDLLLKNRNTAEKPSEEEEAVSNKHNEYIKSVFPLRTMENVSELEANLQTDVELKKKLVRQIYSNIIIIMKFKQSCFQTFIANFRV